MSSSSNNDQNKSNLTRSEVFEHIRHAEGELRSYGLHAVIDDNITEADTAKAKALQYLQTLQGEIARARRLATASLVEADSMSDTERVRYSVSLDRVAREDLFRVTAFYAGLSGAAVFSLAALSFAVWAVIGTFKIEGGVWFLMVLPPAFIVPATVIFITLVRAVYPPRTSDDVSENKYANVPHVKVLSEILSALKDPTG